MTYKPPVRDYAFLLRDVLELEKYADLPAFAGFGALAALSVTTLPLRNFLIERVACRVRCSFSISAKRT